MKLIQLCNLNYIINISKMQTNQLNIYFEKIYPDAIVPTKQTKGSSGYDLSAYICSQEGNPFDVTIFPNKKILISTGIKLSIPYGYEGQIRSRSGLASKHGIFVLNSPGTIDSDYRGEIKIILFNLGDDKVIIHHGERIAQIIIAPTINVKFIEGSLCDTYRGSNGFGSTS